MSAFPIGQSFQRLNNFPLDNTYVFETLIEAEQYAIHNKTAYIGQIVYIKDARSIDENGEGAENYDGLFIIDHYKTLRPLFKFILSTLKTDSGNGLTSDGISIDTTNVKEILGIEDPIDNSEELEEIRDNIENLANTIIPFQEHLDTYQDELNILQENIDGHTHSLNDIRSLDSTLATKVNDILQGMDIESGIIDENALLLILQQNGYATSEDILRLYELIQTCIDKEFQLDFEIEKHKTEEYEVLLADHNAHKEFVAEFYEEFLNHFHTISQIEGDNPGDDNLRTELDKDQKDLADYKIEMEEKLGDIAALLDEINGEII